MDPDDERHRALVWSIGLAMIVLGGCLGWIALSPRERGVPPERWPIRRAYYRSDAAYQEAVEQSEEKK